MIFKTAISILGRFREIDVSTTESKKAGIKASFNVVTGVGSGARVCDHHRGVGDMLAGMPTTLLLTVQSKMAATKGSFDVAPVLVSNT